MSSVARMWSWRVHVYGGPVALERARRGARRGAGQLLVRVSAAALNPLDHAMRDGYGRSLLNIQRSCEGRLSDELPLVLGREFTGEAAGGGGIKVGTQLWGVVPPHWPGSLQEYVLVDREWVSPAPRSLERLSAAGSLYAAMSACAALRAAGVAPGGDGGGGGGARVAVAGLGAVGAAAVQLLRRAGCDVTAVAGAGAEQRARQLGAHRLVDRHDKELDRLLREAGPFHAVLDCAGLGGAGARRGWRCARYVTLSSPLLRQADRRGALLGALAAAAEGARDSITAAMRARDSTLGHTRSLLPPHVRWAFFQANQKDIQLLRKLAERGELVTQVDQVIPWRCAGAVLNGGTERASSGGVRGKIVLDFRDDAPPEQWQH